MIGATMSVSCVLHIHSFILLALKHKILHLHNRYQQFSDLDIRIHIGVASPCKSHEMCCVSKCTCMSIRVG